MPHRLLLDGTNYLSLDGTNRLALDGTPIIAAAQTIPAFTQTLTMVHINTAVLSQTINDFAVALTVRHPSVLRRLPQGAMGAGGRPRRAK